MLGMPQNFLECDREQVFLFLPDPRDWLPEGHLAWFVLASVQEMDLDPFYGSYREDGWGRAAFEPSMMVSLLLYAYARGERSSRGIERKCVEDVAYRVIAAQQKPDHATIARFRARHEDALAELFSSVLGLCRRAGLVKVGVIAIDGTKMHANASHHSNLDYEQLAREILKEAGDLDAAEDAWEAEDTEAQYSRSMAKKVQPRLDDGDLPFASSEIMPVHGYYGMSRSRATTQYHTGSIVAADFMERVADDDEELDLYASLAVRWGRGFYLRWRTMHEAELRAVSHTERRPSRRR